MAARIFSIEEDGHLLQMDEEACRTEDEFQDLLSNYPELLGGDEIDSSSPRRWLLVKREMGVPAGEEGEERWSLDHLFLDQDGVPTLVEVKRISDTRIRRTVVAQMLDYAANAVVYWPVERIRAAFEAGEADAAEKLAGLLGEGSDPEQFWAKVKTNLQAGRIRMLFVADAIPPELRRIVEFLNEQMDPAEVLAVEIRRYVGGGVRTLVPRVIGQTAEAETRKRGGADRGRATSRLLWDQSACSVLRRFGQWGYDAPQTVRIAGHCGYTVNASTASCQVGGWNSHHKGELANLPPDVVEQINAAAADLGLPKLAGRS